MRKNSAKKQKSLKMLLTIRTFSDIIFIYIAISMP